MKEGYVYSKEDRTLRDLLRKRWHLVKLRTSLMVSLKNILSRNFGLQRGSSRIKDESLDVFVSGLPGEDIASSLSEPVRPRSIFLTIQIDEVELAVLEQAKNNPFRAKLLEFPGVGKVLALTLSSKRPCGSVPESRQLCILLPKSREPVVQ